MNIWRRLFIWLENSNSQALQTALYRRESGLSRGWEAAAVRHMLVAGQIYRKVNASFEKAEAL